MALKSQVPIDELVVSQSSARRAHVDLFNSPSYESSEWKFIG